MATELKATASAIRHAQSELYEIDTSTKYLYTLLDKFRVLEVRGQLSADVVEDLSTVLLVHLWKKC